MGQIRWDDLYIGGVAASLGRKEPTAEAVAEGRYDADRNEVDGYLSVRVADKGPAVDLAIAAANEAVDRAGPDVPDFAAVLHASYAHQGLDHFAAASYIQQRTVRGSAMALEVDQGSNGGLAALEVACAYLQARTEPASVLLTTSDRFVPPAWDRYRTDRGTVFGDGGTALVLSRGDTEGGRGKVAKVLSTAIVGDTRFVDLYIGEEPWTDASGEAWPLDLCARRDGYLALHGLDVLLELMLTVAKRQRATIETALTDAGLTSGEVQWWAFPNMGRQVIDWEFRRMLGIDEDRTTWEWGRRVGHLGAGDTFGALAHLVESGAAKAGDKVVLFSIGQGDNYGCAVVEVLEERTWERTAS